MIEDMPNVLERVACNTAGAASAQAVLARVRDLVASYRWPGGPYPGET